MKKSSKIFVIFVFLFLNFSFSQNKKDTNIIMLAKSSFYMVCRGTSSKIGFVTGFNLNDKSITHVGIGIVNKNKINIYNVNNEHSETGNLFVQKLQDFVYPTDINYLSIWEYKSNEKEINLLRNILQKYSKKKITFDMDFNDNGDDNFYCSEFCATILNKINPHVFKFQKVSKRLDLIYSNALHRDILNYYPVDFFQTNNNFKKIYEAKY